MKAQNRLREAVQMAQAGRHAEALSEYEWFHNHSLDEEPALHGVRLSFALSYWFELGQSYPPALASLVAIRDDKARRVLEGCGSWDLFSDVSAINETLGNEAATYDLFLSIHAISPEFAKECSRVAFPAIFHSQDYALARTFLPEPEASLRRAIEMLNENMEWAAATTDDEARAAHQEAFTSMCVEDVSRLLKVLRETGSTELAHLLYGQALELVDASTKEEFQVQLSQRLGSE
jgi:hypothetical protein